MNCNASLLELLTELSTSNAPVIVNWDTIQQWPTDALDQLIRAGVLSAASSAQSIECNGCAHRCFMDVLIQVNEGHSVDRAFVVCDEPEMQSQMGRIQIPLARLKQWKTSFKQLAGVIAELLGFDNKIEYNLEENAIRLGMLKSKSGRRWVSLFNQPLTLEINGFKTPVKELLFIEDNVLVIDHLHINRLLESKPLSTGKTYIRSCDKREARKQMTQAMYQSWNDEYLLLIRKYPNKKDTWYSIKIAKLPIAQGKSSETIRKNMKN